MKYVNVTEKINIQPQDVFSQTNRLNTAACGKSLNNTTAVVSSNDPSSCHSKKAAQEASSALHVNS